MLLSEVKSEGMIFLRLCLFLRGTRMYLDK